MPEKDLSHLSEEDRNYIHELREEAKARRLENTSLNEKLVEANAAIAKLPDLESQLNDLKDVRTRYDTLRDEHAQSLSRGESTELELTRLRVALAAEIPHTFADRLKGGTKEELEADAKLLKDSLGAGKNGNRVLFDRTNQDPPKNPQNGFSGFEFPSIAQHIAEVQGNDD